MSETDGMFVGAVWKRTNHREVRVVISDKQYDFREGPRDYSECPGPIEGLKINATFLSTLKEALAATPKDLHPLIREGYEKAGLTDQASGLKRKLDRLPVSQKEAIKKAKAQPGAFLGQTSVGKYVSCFGCDNTLNLEIVQINEDGAVNCSVCGATIFPYHREQEQKESPTPTQQEDASPPPPCYIAAEEDPTPALQQQIDALTEEVGWLKDRQTLSPDLAEHARHLTEQFEQITDRLRGLEELHVLFDRLIKRIGEVENRIDKLEGRQVTLVGLHDLTVQNLKEHKQRLDDQADSGQLILEETSEIHAALSEALHRIDQLEEQSVTSPLRGVPVEAYIPTLQTLERLFSGQPRGGTKEAPIVEHSKSLVLRRLPRPTWLLVALCAVLGGLWLLASFMGAI